MKKSLLALILGSTLALAACDQAKKTTSEATAPATEAPATDAPATDKAPETK